MTFNDFAALCNQRRSIRYFADKPVPKDAIEKLVAAANLAPSIENTQPWHFHIVTNAELRAMLMQASAYGNFVAGAAVFIVVTCNKLSKPKTQQLIWNPKELEYSCMCALEQFLLAATAMGLGSCFVSLHHGPAHDILKLKDHQAVVGGIMLGYPKTGEETGNDGHERRPVKETMTWYE